MSDAHQPGVDFLHSRAVILNKFLANRLFKSKDTSQYKLGSVKACKGENGSLPFFVHPLKTSLLKIHCCM